jgi:DNA primase
MRREQQPIDVAALKRRHSLLEVAQQLTPLRRISGRGEFAGPCPCCGGVDRFHVKGERFYCRQCTPRGGDVLDLVQLVYHVSFREACQLLADTPAFSSERLVLPSQIEADRAQRVLSWQNEAYQASARKTLGATQRLLFQSEGAEGRAYLTARGLSEVTWRTYRLGFGRIFHPIRRENRAAIFIPWLMPDQTIAAIQHRFIAADLAKHERYSLKPGSQPRLFGLQALTPAPRLFVVEGEFNCMALHQIGEQALSLGSETNRGNPQALALLHKKLADYADVIVWFDQPAVGEQVVTRLRAAEPFRGKSLRWVTAPQDANGLLVAGSLADFVEERWR